jgi:SAM-dependent methyltransferase
VLQHNQAAVVRHYLGEIARVLRPGGRCVLTCFLLAAKRREADRGEESLRFPHPLEDCWTANPALPEVGIAFRERDFRRWAADRGLALRARFDGYWHSTRWSQLYQDLLILQKRAA